MSPHIVRSEVTGTVLKLEVGPGDRVAEDDVLFLVESMKMEIPVLAGRAGQVSSLDVAEGDGEIEPVVSIKVTGCNPPGVDQLAGAE